MKDIAKTIVMGVIVLSALLIILPYMTILQQPASTIQQPSAPETHQQQTTAEQPPIFQEYEASEFNSIEAAPQPTPQPASQYERLVIEAKSTYAGECIVILPPVNSGRMPTELPVGCSDDWKGLHAYTEDEFMALSGYSGLIDKKAGQ